MRVRLGVGTALVAATVLAGCAENPLGPPRVSASFLTPAYFTIAIAGDDDAEAPALRTQFYAASEAYARANGCVAYRVMKEIFTTSANIAPRVTTHPSWVFGRRPVYSGFVECELPKPSPVLGGDGA